MFQSELIENQGYAAQVHTTETSDGFVLTMQRLPCEHLRANCSGGRPAVLLQHGLLASATNWLTNPRNESLGAAALSPAARQSSLSAFLLADAGFDVWLGNVRGNVYSRKHTTLQPSSWRFWDFSWQDMADKDLPAMVAKVLDVTGKAQLDYIGHSQGTLIAFAQLSSDRQFAKKVKRFVALAPVATVGHIQSLVRLVAPFSSIIKKLADLFGLYSFDDLTKLLAIFKPFCLRQKRYLTVCENIAFLFIGREDRGMINQTRIPVYMAHNPAGTSIKDVIHFGQMVVSGVMQKYDYGARGNLHHYGTKRAPVFNLKRVRTPTTLFWSPTDALADATDVALLMQRLRRFTSIKVANYSHIDFLWALSARVNVYEPIIKLLKNDTNHF